MESELALQGPLAWLRLILGLAVFLAPGVAIADRIFDDRRYLLLAPVFSFSALALAAILLDFAMGVPINTWTTASIAAGLTSWAGWPRIVEAQQRLRVRMGWAHAS